VSYDYNAQGQKIGVTDATGTTQFGYDNWGNLQSLTDAAGQMTRFGHDTIGKLRHEIRPLNQQTSFSYDPQGRLDTITDAMQQVTDYGYDDQSRLDTIDYADDRNVRLSYDADGNLSGYDDGVPPPATNTTTWGARPRRPSITGHFPKPFRIPIPPTASSKALPPRTARSTHTRTARTTNCGK
jgi:YD repeat-containing protein